VGEAAAGGAVAVGAGDGDAVALGTADSAAEGAGGTLSLGTAEAVGVTVAGAEAEAVGEGVGLLFLFADFLRGFGVGVGVGLTNRCLILSTMLSFCAAPHSGEPTEIISVSASATDHRVASLIPLFGLTNRRQLLQHSLIHSDAGVEIVQRKVFVRRMRAAIVQRQPEQQRFDT